MLALVRRRVSAADLGVAFCLGVAVLGVAISLLATAGYVAGVPVFLLLAALASAPLIATRTRLRARRRPPWRRLRHPSALALVLAVGALAMYSVALLRVAAVDWLDEYDAWAMWTMKAKALVVYGDLAVANSVGAAHPDYPILVPVLQSLVFRFVGAFDTQLVHVEHALLAIAFVGAAWRLAAARLPAAVGAVWALYALVLPGVQRNVPDALADVPVAVFVALAAIAFASWLVDGRHASLVLFVVFGAAACWTKNEGLTAVAVIGAVGLAASARRPLRALRWPAVAVAATLLLAAPWRLWASAHGAAYDTDLSRGLDPGFLLYRRDRAERTLENFVGQLADLEVWLGVPYLTLALVGAALLTRRHVRLAAFALAVPMTLLLAYVWVYAIRDDPLGLTWLLATSASRTVTTIGLVATALLPLQLAALVDVRAAGAPTGQLYNRGR